MLLQDGCFGVDGVAVKGGTKMPDVFKFKIGNCFATDILDAHAERNAKDQWSHDKWLFKLGCLSIVSVDVEWMMVHGEHTKQRVVMLGDCAPRPVFVERANLKLFVTTTKLRGDISHLWSWTKPSSYASHFWEA